MFKKILVALLIFGEILASLQIFSTPTEAAHIAAYDTATVINVSEYVNLREEPSTNSAILARVPRGAEVEVLAEWLPGQHNGFYKVIYRGIHGCIHKNYLSVTWGR